MGHYLYGAGLSILVEPFSDIVCYEFFSFGDPKGKGEACVARKGQEALAVDMVYLT